MDIPVILTLTSAQSSAHRDIVGGHAGRALDGRYRHRHRPRHPRRHRYAIGWWGRGLLLRKKLVRLERFRES